MGGPGSKPPRDNSHDPDLFVANQCIGSNTSVTDCTSALHTRAVVHGNMYYMAGVGGAGSDVCPNNKSAVSLEHGGNFFLAAR